MEITPDTRRTGTGMVNGHTKGSATLHIASRDTMFVGDALATLNVVTGATGPQLAPFGSDIPRARESLGRLERMEARFVLPGHGQPWAAGLPEAARLAREAGLPGWRQPTGSG